MAWDITGLAQLSVQEGGGGRTVLLLRACTSGLLKGRNKKNPLPFHFLAKKTSDMPDDLIW